MFLSREYGKDDIHFHLSYEEEEPFCQLPIDVWNSPKTFLIGYSRKERFPLSGQERNDMEKVWYEGHIPWMESH